VFLLLAGLFVSLGLILLVDQGINWLTLGHSRAITIFDVCKGFLPEKILIWLMEPKDWKDWKSLWRIVNEVLSWSMWWILMLLAVPFASLSYFVTRASAKLSLRP